MSRLDELPPDQRAALSLLLRQRKSYADVAVLLGIAERAVHDRAHAALAVLAPRQARGLSAERREQIGDYLLGQQPGVAERLRTRTRLASEESERAWALAIAEQLAGLGAPERGEIPEPLSPPAHSPPPAPGPPPAPPRATAGARAAGPVAAPERASTLGAHARAATAGTADTAGEAPWPSSLGAPSSRLGGALLLGALVVAVVVAVILIASSSGGSGSGKASAKATTSTASTKAGPAQGPKLALHSPNAASRSVGVVEILSEGSKRAFYIDAEHLPQTRNFFYAIWLYNSRTSAEALSKSPAVGTNHKLAGGALLPANAGQFHEILLTRETSTHPTKPGTVVLRGVFSLG
jgi:hypothetical protein